ncbi:MAG: geranylgeranylglycerol-phosphate geranylgeranyltransferase [Cytophagaceae bacterium]|nr:geranylgeranylglycerol-phosphate geranylgeranyltransferase [Cytophagaceae bacterium]
MARKLHLKSSLSAFLKLIRFGNLVILVLTQYFAAIFLAGPKENWKSIITDINLFLIVLSTGMIAAAGYIINDYYDIKIDMINKPKRVVVGKLLTRRIAIFGHTVLNFTGILIGLIVSWKIAAVNFLAAYFLWLYSNSLKRLPLVGNIIVSALTSLSILIIALYYKKNELLIINFAVFAFFISLIREIIKDMEDVKGDSAFGCRTLPLVYGIRKTKIFLYMLLVLFLIILLLLGKDFRKEMVYYFSALILLPVIFLIIRLTKADNSKDFRVLSRICKFIMVGGVVSMVFI